MSHDEPYIDGVRYQREDVQVFRDAIRKAADEQLAHIMANRDAYVKAWIAETGLLPSECVLEESRCVDADGSVVVTMRVRKAAVT